ncbi:hypothetical protein Cmtc_17020 [Cupriavidus sp. TKC]|uniref:tyrosine-type recombinase/integrase n=1 Tax=Cupriavidus sp. TKC TaxID=2880159 RepID=UPI0025A8FB27|nr:tyrosine-type recombinase/integrase [Cupriavidus sp. TKC]GMG90482.1 hypothetical protein Cmtc_17020 [Cupriavidus sp. TKC]
MPLRARIIDGETPGTAGADADADAPHGMRQHKGERNVQVINPKFLEKLIRDHVLGKEQQFADPSMANLAIRISKTARITFLLRTQKPEKNSEGRSKGKNKQGSRVLGSWPTLTLEEARELAIAELQMTDIKRDTLAARERKRQKREDASMRTNPLTIGQFVDETYGPWLIANTKRGTERIQTLKGAFFHWLAMPLVAFRAKFAEEWKTQALTKGIELPERNDKKKRMPPKPVGPATVNRHLNILRGMFSRALEWGEIAVHPMTGVKNLGEPEGRERQLTPEEESALFQVLDKREEALRVKRDNGNRRRLAQCLPLYPDLRAVPFADYLKVLVILFLRAGLRRQEGVGLRWRDINFIREQIHVRKELSKTGKARYVPMSSEVVETLRLWHTQTGGSYVFPGRGGRDHLKDPKGAWKAVLKAACIEDFRLHDCRHDFASKLVSRGANLPAVGALLGHKSPSMTQRYAHLAPGYLKDVVSLLDQ